ncbi:MAG: anti-sigma factor [Planctomycetota bacterium]
MSAQHDGRHPSESRQELAAIAAVEGMGVLDPSEAEEVDHALVGEYEHAAGAVFAALAGAPRRSHVPSSVLERIEEAVLTRAGASGGASARRGLGRADVPRSQRNGHSSGPRHRAGVDEAVRESFPSEDEAPPRSSGLALAVGLGGWVAAAAAVIVMVTTSAGRAPVDPAALAAELREVEPDTQVLAWQTEGVEGDVTWSDARHQGVLRIAGLAVNDPSVEQYQLWIFENGLDDLEEHPVDGGVFDVTSEGEILVPIDSKIRASRGTTFVVTAEKPGGVVVSDRKRIRAVATRA